MSASQVARQEVVERSRRYVYEEGRRAGKAGKARAREAQA